jgi:hypothetical protein
MVRGGWVEGGGDSCEGIVAVVFAQGGFLWVFDGGGFEFEPWREARQQATKGFEVGSNFACVSVAGCGFDGHPAAEISIFEGGQDRVGDSLHLLKPVGSVLFGGGRGVGGAGFDGKGGGGSCGQGAEEEAAAVWGRLRHRSPSVTLVVCGVPAPPPIARA